MPDVALIVQVVYLAGTGLTLTKLLRTGLYRHYRVFAWYLSFSVLDSIWPLFVDTSSQIYLKLYVCKTPVLWAFYVLMIRELYHLILDKHRGLYTLGRWAMYVSLAIAVTLSLLTLLPKIKPEMPQASKVMGYVVACERGVDLSLALFILLILGFLTIYPVPLSRNVIVHVVVYSVFFLSTTLSFTMRSLFGLRLIAEVNLLLMGTAAACTLAWFFLLTPKGEEVRVNLPWLSPEHESRLLTQLDALNATLLKASRN